MRIETAVYHFLREMVPYHCKYEVKKSEHNGLMEWHKVPGSEERCNCYDIVGIRRVLAGVKEA